MNRFKLVTIKNNKVYYTNNNDIIENTNLYNLPDQDIIHYFSQEDQEIINSAAVDDGFYIGISRTGERTLVPYKRQNYIFFFIAVFTLSIVMSMFTCIRYIQVGNTTLYGSFLFFPLAFACTDIINELYGYNRVRSVIKNTVIALLIMAGLLEITLSLNGQLTNGDSDADLLKLFTNLPILIVVNSVSLLISDSLNAYLFYRLKNKLQGRALWLRSIVSTFTAHFFNSTITMILIIQAGLLSIPLKKIIDLMFSGHLVKMLYAVCSLPLIYGAVYFVKYKENEQKMKSAPA